ncbi:MAG: sigma-70 family RNA polymerase sigma factor [Chloroflexi bacterium]|nr:sigma-70 family RNA polymerase sigma factor [Chloroflexota bacterium]
MIKMHRPSDNTYFGKDTDELSPSFPSFESIEEEIHLLKRASKEVARYGDLEDIVDIYLREVQKIPLLKPEEEVELAQAIAIGQHSERQLSTGQQISSEERFQLHQLVERGHRAQSRLVEANSRLVVSIAKRYRGAGVPMMDLIQEGYWGLIRAAEKFDGKRGLRFSTYAVWWVRQAVARAVADQGRTIRLPVEIHQRLRKMRQISQRLTQTLGREASNTEIGAELGLADQDVANLRKYSQSPMSLNDLTRDDGERDDSSWGETLSNPEEPQPDDSYVRQELAEELALILQSLPARESRVLELRYGLQGENPRKLGEVGELFGLTRERIRQIENEALQRLRRRHRYDRLHEYTA